MQKWQYETFAFSAINGQVLKDKLNALGQEGWEYCGASAFPITGEDEKGQPVSTMLYCYLFKRPEQLIQVPGGTKFTEREVYGPGNPQFINGG